MDPYKFFDLPYNCSQEQIKQKYKQYVLQWHPDKNNSENAAEIFRNIQIAYESINTLHKPQLYNNMTDDDKFDLYHTLQEYLSETKFLSKLYNSFIKTRYEPEIINEIKNKIKNKIDEFDVTKTNEFSFMNAETIYKENINIDICITEEEYLTKKSAKIYVNRKNRDKFIGIVLLNQKQIIFDGEGENKYSDLIVNIKITSTFN